jgi:transcription termination factor Rho
MAKSVSKSKKTSKRKRKTTKKKAVIEEQETPEQTEQIEEQKEPGTTTSEEAAGVEAKDEAQRAKEAEEESTHAKYERIKKGDLYLADLQKLTVAELHDLAKKENITE